MGSPTGSFLLTLQHIKDLLHQVFHGKTQTTNRKMSRDHSLALRAQAL